MGLRESVYPGRICPKIRKTCVVPEGEGESHRARVCPVHASRAVRSGYFRLATLPLRSPEWPW
jgi:hypothetical protein